MLKIERDLQGETNPTIIKVGNELIRRSTTDSTLHEAFNKPHKSLKGMFKYIKSEAQKLAVEGATSIDDDDIVYGWAQHYYDEDGIDPVINRGEVKSEKVSTNSVILPVESLDDFDL